MQLSKHQWRLGSIILRGPSRALKCSSWSSTHRCPNAPLQDASSWRQSSTLKSTKEYGLFTSQTLEQDTTQKPAYTQSSSHGVQKERQKKLNPNKRSWVSSAYALRKYLSFETAQERAKYWASVENKVQWSDLPIILLLHMHMTAQNKSKDDTLPVKQALKKLHSRSTQKLASLGYDTADLERWAWIVAPRNPDDIALRLVSTSRETPIFLLFLALRGEIQKVRTLKALLVYVWDCVMGMARPDLRTAHPINGTRSPPLGHRRIFHKHSLDESAFNLLISVLLNHTRRLWPSAMLTVSNLIPPYILSTTTSSHAGQTGVPAKNHAKASTANNRFIRVFALPASIDPVKSMSYNWAAQRVLLQLAGQFQPPLTLDKRSYEAVVQVLNALKKTDQETKVASLRARSWPPWREYQDGMDADRSLEDDQSRAISAIIRSKEAGYSANLFDQTMSIFAGQEIDGTPTIHTRKQIKARSAHRQSETESNELDPLLWAARIEATRDVGEAWNAFVTFEEKGGKPNQNIYFSMFQKIEYENRRIGQAKPFTPSPGDGREVFPVSDDNFSEFYKKRFQPPDLYTLYRKMTNSGLPPRGRSLNFLVRHARTLDEGFDYLRDSGMDKSMMALFEADPHTELSAGSLDNVPLPIFASIIHLLSRFAPRAFQLENSDLSNHELENATNVKVDGYGRKWVIRKARPQNWVYQANPLHQAALLLTHRKPSYRPAWYALFKGLAGRHALLSPNWEDVPNNDHVAWKVLVAALAEFHRCGLELDPFGFILVCRTFDKYATDYFGGLDGKTAEVIKASEILKTEFAKLTEVVDAADILPLFMHSIHGAHLHAYIRCLGLVDDHREILNVLRWMVKYQEELEKVAAKSQNGSRLLRQALVAARIFMSGTEYEMEAIDIIEEVEDWDGWPTEEEILEYNASKLGSDERDSDAEPSEALEQEEVSLKA